MALKIIFAFVALGIGVYFGMPGRYDRSIDEIEEVMDSGTARRKKVKRRFTPFAWMQRQVSVGTRGSRGNHKGRGFEIKAPDDR